MNINFDLPTILFAFGLTLMAGLATGIGSCIAFLAKRTNTRFLCVSLGFSAGVMLCVSFVEMMVKAREALTLHLGDMAGNWAMVLAFSAASPLSPRSTNWCPATTTRMNCIWWKNWTTASQGRLHHRSPKVHRRG